ncbi:MAG: DNA polymerase I, partial [Parcubacteria group bacterium Gr01-1014_72]
SGEDVHMAVAAEVFGIPRSEVTKEMRRRAKAINFGMLYGMGVNSLRQSIGGTREEAETFYKKYFTRFSRLTEYLEGVKASVARKGYTETFFGRRRAFEAITSKIPYIRAAAERMAINAPIQGTQSDIIKLAMVRIDAFLQKEGLGDRTALILQVHDELVYEIEEGLVTQVAPKLKHFMEGVLSLEETKGVPIVVDVAVGKNWGEMKKMQS